MVWTTIASALIYWLGLEYLQYKSEAGLEDYDVQTTTVSDFTVQYDIPPGMYATFKKDKAKRLREKMSAKLGHPVPTIMAF